MPAPTALQRRPEELADDVAMSTPRPGDEPTEAADLIDMDAVADDVLPDTNHAAAGDDTAMVDESGRPQFAPSKSIPLAFRRETRKVPIPPHRMTPLKSAWPKIYVSGLPSPARLPLTAWCSRRWSSTCTCKCA